VWTFLETKARQMVLGLFIACDAISSWACLVPGGRAIRAGAV
jgi:hypothetical protein